jgi:hypothetical protein
VLANHLCSIGAVAERRKNGSPISESNRNNRYRIGAESTPGADLTEALIGKIARGTRRNSACIAD